MEEAFAFNRSLANIDAISRGFGTELCTREFGFRGRNLKQAFHQALRSAMRRRSVDFPVVWTATDCVRMDFHQSFPQALRSAMRRRSLDFPIVWSATASDFSTVIPASFTQSDIAAEVLISLLFEVRLRCVVWTEGQKKSCTRANVEAKDERILREF